MKTNNNPKPRFNMFQSIWFMVKTVWKGKEKRIIFLSLILVFSSVVLNLLNLYVTPSILSAIEQKVPLSELFMIILFFTFGLLFVSALSAYVEPNVMGVAGRMLVVESVCKKSSITSYPNLLDDRFNKLKAQAWDYTGNNSASTEDVWRTMTSILTNMICFVFYLAMMSSFNPILVTVVIITSIISYFFSSWANRWRYEHRDDSAENAKQMLYINKKTRDITFAKDIRIFGLQPWLEEIYQKAMGCYIAKQAKAESKALYASIADLVLSFLQNGIVYSYLIYLVFAGNITVSGFLLYFTAVGGFTTWVIGILSDFNKLQKQSVDISTIRELLEYPEPFKFEEGKELRIDKNHEYEIKLENVTFRYQNASKDTLKNINLTLKRGEKLAIVGLNGAGKTTLIKLICGFLDPTDGRVLLDGVDIRIYNRNDYYNLFSAVFQNFTVLPGSIISNVVQDFEDVDFERVKDCIEKAGLKDKVESLPDGYGTYLNREVYNHAIMLSGGETQRLMLARCLYKDSPVIVLDEPTAALDPIAESDMYQKYNEMTKGKSSIYISHRLASTRFCDRIILIDNGVISEEGSHESLMSLGGKYAKLFEVQKKYYEEGGDCDEK